MRSSIPYPTRASPWLLGTGYWLLGTVSAVNARRYRQILIGSIASLVGLVVAVLIVNPLGEEAALPRPLEGVFPLPGDTVVRQTAIEVDLPIGYSLELTVDGVTIPQTEIGFTRATGRYLWQPGPTTLFELWGAGDHEVTIHWERTSGGGPDPGQFTWTFRIT